MSMNLVATTLFFSTFKLLVLSELLQTFNTSTNAQNLERFFNIDRTYVYILRYIRNTYGNDLI